MDVQATESSLRRFGGELTLTVIRAWDTIRYGRGTAGARGRFRPEGRRLSCERGDVGVDASGGNGCALARRRGSSSVSRMGFHPWGAPMITLNMRLTAKRGREDDLLRAIRDRWMEAMSRQPGFVRGVLLEPYSGAAAAKVGLSEKEFTFEVVSFWETEEDRAAWAASEIHAEVIAGVNDAVEPDGGKDSALFTVKCRWGEE